MWFEISWSREAEEHIARHSIAKTEVDDMLRSERYYWRKHAGGLMIIGRVHGRYLVLFLRRLAPNSRRLEIGTCRPAEPEEKALLYRRGKGIR